jgi:hypothetical protein
MFHRLLYGSSSFTGDETDDVYTLMPCKVVGVETSTAIFASQNHL